MKTVFLSTLLAVLSAPFSACQSDSAGASREDLAQKANNPVAAMISVPVDNEFYLGVGPQRDTVYALQVKPVVPFTLNSKWNLLTRYILPVGHVPDLFGGLDFLPQNRPTGSATGSGDITFTAWLTPAQLPRVGKARMLLAAGTAIMLPTASSSNLGTGRWNGGPSVLAGYMRGRMIAGALVQNIWSFAGPADRRRIHQLLVQAFWSYRLGRGWSVVVSPPMAMNWLAANDRWTVPVGPGLSKLVRIGKMPVSFGGEVTYYAARPLANGPRWAVRLSTKFLLPR